MVITKEYKNAFMEVSKILSCIDKEDFNKIPKDVIYVIEQNKNLDYEYNMNKELDIFKQPMLLKTRVILYNIFRDYWATQNQRQDIIKMQAKERYMLEEIKKNEYNKEIFRKKENRDKVLSKNEEKRMNMPVVKKGNFIYNLFDKIKRWIKIK